MRPASSSLSRQPEAPPVVVEPAATSPAWFRSALADVPVRSSVAVEGADIEVLAWGTRGQPGVLLLHGYSAHADWWSFIAPQLRRGRRVVACSLSGMGRSGWRDTYSLEQYAREALAVAEATGLFAAPLPPVLIGHSFGTYVARTVARDAADLLGGIVLIDGVLAVDEDDYQYDGVPRRGHRHRIYPEHAQALARFRLSPPQPCENAFVAEFLARTSLRDVSDEAGAQGWSWCFDPDLRAKLDALPVAALRFTPTCPSSLVFGERSQLLTPRRVELLRQVAQANTPWIEVPDAGHHVMVDQPLALVAALRAQLEAWQPHACLSAG